MSEQTGVYGDLDSLECLNIWSVWRFVQSGMFEHCEVSGDLDSLEYLNRQYLE